MTLSRTTALLLTCAALASFPALSRAESLADHLVIVYNEVLPESESLAHYYADARHIPDSRIVGVRCPINEEISRAEYQSQIEKPLRDAFVKKGWLTLAKTTSPFGDQTLTIQAATSNDVWCIVLMKGVPLKIANDPTLQEPPTTNPQLNTNAASVDSELTLLPMVGLPRIGALPNPYQLLGYQRRFDSLDARSMVLVARLDAPNANTVRRMIDDAIFAEGRRLTGRAALDTRGLDDAKSGYFQGDEWLLASADLLAKQGWEIELDKKPEIFPDNKPWRDLAIYAGWYAPNASGPFMRGTPDDPIFERGAIAYHIHSFSAATLRSETENWCGPLLLKGAAATMGAVYEPYLDFMPRWDTFLRRLTEGGTFIESAYVSQKVLSWMTVFVGDPLYTPFALNMDKALAESPQGSVQRDFLRLQMIRANLAAGKLDDAKIGLGALMNDPKLTRVGWEGWADITSDPRLLPPNATVAEAYERAFNMSTVIDDQIRTDLKAVHAYEDRFREKDARRLLQLMLNRYTNQAVYYGFQDALRQLDGNGGIPSGTPSLAPNSLAPVSNVPAIPPAVSGPASPALNSQPSLAPAKP